ncbi:hypothetical protein pb186bvf_018379 [Paramecium bursaria]
MYYIVEKAKNTNRILFLGLSQLSKYCQKINNTKIKINQQQYFLYLDLR